jgi:hypothetical protein
MQNNVSFMKFWSFAFKIYLMYVIFEIMEFYIVIICLF